MSLITPDFGLIFWMVVIFGLVFFILAKFGFPIITKAVGTRSDHIAQSLEAAAEAKRSLAGIADERQKVLEQTRADQARILKEASLAREEMLSQARAQAGDEAASILRQARTQIAAEKESALRDIRGQVASLSVDVAEKVLRRELSGEQAQLDLISRLVDELSDTQDIQL